MTTNDARRGQALKGSQTEWSKRRLAANLSITELANRSGVARSLVGLIDQGRLVPTPDQAAAILAALGEAA
jgi:transcriptional regulator with XRE-family HTH domain